MAIITGGTDEENAQTDTIPSLSYIKMIDIKWMK